MTRHGLSKAYLPQCAVRLFPWWGGGVPLSYRGGVPLSCLEVPQFCPVGTGTSVLSRDTPFSLKGHLTRYWGTLSGRDMGPETKGIPLTRRHIGPETRYPSVFCGRTVTCGNITIPRTMYAAGKNGGVNFTVCEVYAKFCGRSIKKR